MEWGGTFSKVVALSSEAVAKEKPSEIVRPAATEQEKKHVRQGRLKINQFVGRRSNTLTIIGNKPASEDIPQDTHRYLCAEFRP